MSKQSEFNSRVGVILAAAGSAVGLGNIWKFPYMVGENGGGAFLLVYVACCILIGLPLMVTEFSIGKRTGRGLAFAFRELAGNNHWQWLGVLGALIAFLLLGFYTVVTGWCLEYLWQSCLNTFHGMTTGDLESYFATYTSSNYRPIIWSAIALASTATISWMGVQGGIERMSKLLMPLLLVILVLLIGRAFMMPGCDEGMRFLFRPDFSKITPSVLLNAMGQSFFSLSLGMGILVTYGSYMPKSQNLVATSAQVTVLDTAVAILAGVAIFPAVFAMGVAPTEGPKLVFVILPTVFDQMSLGALWSVLFFMLISMAAITSVLALLEATISYVTDRWKLERNKTILLVCCLLFVFMVLSSLSITGHFDALCPFGMSFFDILDNLTSKILMPICALGILIFIGWRIPRKNTQDELLTRSAGKYKNLVFDIYFFLIRYILPLIILLIFLNGFGIV